MKRAAIGVRMHSGWGILVAVAAQATVVDRRRIVVATNDGPRGNQPYHRAQQLGLAKAEEYLADYTAETDRLSQKEISRVMLDLKTRGYEIVRAAILLASGRALPLLPEILAAHPLIHTAEGELFRSTICRACASLNLPVMGIRERNLEADANQVFAAGAAQIIHQLAQAGRTLGPPWN